MIQKNRAEANLNGNIYYSATTACATISSCPKKVQSNSMNSIKAVDGLWSADYSENRTNYRKYDDV